MSERWRLLGDIGGTNVRFGLSREAPAGGTDEIANLRSRPSNMFTDFDAALHTYLEALDPVPRISSAAIAAAGPTATDSVKLTNRDWTITADGLRRAIGAPIATRLLNDLEAVAHALPFLPSDAVEWWDDRRPPSAPTGRRLAINVGTGFGSAALLGTASGWVCCPAESGHMQLGFVDERERRLIAAVGGNGATVEDVLSGEGAVRLWRAVADSNAGQAGAISDHDTFDFAASGPAMAEARAVFSAFLARTCANLVLAATAWDGVYFCGSVVTAWAAQAERTLFRQAFNGTAKMSGRLDQTPVGLLRHPFPALVGLANLEMPQPLA